MMVTTGGRGTRFAGSSGASNRPSSTSDSATRRTECPISSATSWAVSASITSVICTICPCFISSRITSTARSAMRLASSWMATAILLLALARLRGVALQPLAALAVGPAPPFLLGDAALLGLADAGVGERVGPRVAFLVGEGAQHDAGRLGRRGRAQRRALHRGGAGCRRLGLPRRRALRDADRLDGLGFARRQRATLHLLHDHRLAAAVAEALTHDSLLDAAF